MDPSFWKILMKRAGNYNLDLDLVLDGVEWPKLCLYTIYEPNLIKSFTSDNELSLSSWKTSSTHWDQFKISQQCSWDRGGGHHWSIENWLEGNPEPSGELLKENNGSVQNYVTSFGWCCREQVITLAEFGLSDGIMDTVRPAIAVSEWFCARWDCGSIFNICVELLGEEKNVIDFFEHSEMTEQWQGGELGWRKVQHVFSGYETGVRCLRFADAGKDTQFWAGHYGSKMAAALVRVLFN